MGRKQKLLFKIKHAVCVAQDSDTGQDQMLLNKDVFKRFST